MVLVKICGITNLNDARVAVEAGAYALGFNFYRRSPRYIHPQDARNIVEQLPSNVLAVGVFVNEAEPEMVARMAEEANLSTVQLHGDESPEYCRALKSLYVIKALRVSDVFVPERVLEYETEAILLDAFDSRERGGTGRTFDWEIARRVRALVPKLYLAGGLSVENVAEAIEKVRPYAVDACSRLESAPGVKDAGRVRNFISAAHVKP
ncbi:MAG: phosphoribosylanthranilate isomerase [Pyrinomonadaceae bacterium]|nr:phosphoribosylanthranilate isomerase [Pyrinomonadaceae bacterium]